MSEKIDDGGFFNPEISCDEASLSNGGTYTIDGGITRRDWLAGLAMQGMLSNPNYMQGLGNTVNLSSTGMGELIASVAFDYADAMIAESRKGE